MGQPGGGIVADPGRMRAVGSAVAEAADTITSGYAGVRDRLVPPAGQVAGWDAGGAVAEAATAWDGFVSQVQRAVSGLAGSVTSAAREYERADADAAGRTGGAGQSPGVVPR